MQLSRVFLCSLVAVGLFSSVTTASAAVIGFVNSPTTNSTDFNAFILANGGAVNTDVNFDGMSTGVLNGGFYSGIGVTLTPTGDVNQVVFGAGPGQGNTSSPPLSPGEGLHPASNYLADGGSASNLVISFATPVLGAGLFVIDYFNPSPSNNPLTIEAFSGANATGTLLGSFTSVAFNFQPNNMYFMGIGSTAGDIRSIRFTDVNSNTGDTTGIDNIRFGTTGVTQVPEPASMLLLGTGLLGAGVRRWRQKRA